MAGSGIHEENGRRIREFILVPSYKFDTLPEKTEQGDGDGDNQGGPAESLQDNIAKPPETENNNDGGELTTIKDSTTRGLSMENSTSRDRENTAPPEDTNLEPLASNQFTPQNTENHTVHEQLQQQHTIRSIPTQQDTPPAIDPGQEDNPSGIDSQGVSNDREGGQQPVVKKRKTSTMADRRKKLRELWMEL